MTLHITANEEAISNFENREFNSIKKIHGETFT